MKRYHVAVSQALIWEWLFPSSNPANVLLKESAGRGASREPPVLRQTALHRGSGAQIQKLLPRGGPSTLQCVSMGHLLRLHQVFGLSPVNSREFVTGRKKNGLGRPNGITK